MKSQSINILRIDFILLLCVLVLIILGAAIMYSASSYKGETQKSSSEYFLSRHLVRVVVGVAIMIIVAAIPYQVWLGLSPIFYVVSLFMLVLLFTGSPFSVAANGSVRWLRFGPIAFQPSDFARYALILLLARVLKERGEELEDFWRGYAKMLLLVGVIVVPIALERDLSTAMMITIIAFVMFFFAQVKLSYLMVTASSFMSITLAYVLTSEYQRQRLISFINQLLESQTFPYQVKQSLISFAQGGLLGRGLGNSLQKYEFLPEAHKDFIFSILGEELGFIGAVFVLGLFMLFIYRGVRIARNAPDYYGVLLAGGITVCIGTYAMFNAGVAVALLPTTGLPMPFFSFGGSSLVSHLAAIGLLINISMQGHQNYANYFGWPALQDRLNRPIFKDKR